MDKIVYNINDSESCQFVDKSIDSMDQWLKSLSDNKLTSWHRSCNKDESERTEDESMLINKYALILYFRELDLTQMSISTDLLGDISARFCVNVIIESLKRRGLAEPRGPLLLYKETKIDLTDKGKKINEENSD